MTVLDHFFLQNMFLMGMTWARIFFQGHFGHFWGPGKVFFQGLGRFLKFAGGFSDLRGDSCVICCIEKCFWGYLSNLLCIKIVYDIYLTYTNF